MRDRAARKWKANMGLLGLGFLLGFFLFILREGEGERKREDTGDMVIRFSSDTRGIYQLS